MIAKIKLKLEIQKRLNELLQKRPDLRSKKLSTFNPSGGGIFKELLSSIRNRQLSLAKINKGLSVKEVKVTQLAEILKTRLVDFSSQTTNAMGNAVIWIPADAPAEQRQKLTKAFSDISNIAAIMAETPSNKLNELKSNFKKLKIVRDQAKALLSDTDLAKLDAEFIDIRMSDHLAMGSSIKSNSELLEYLIKKDHQAFVMYLQKELNTETSNTVLNLSAELVPLTDITAEINATLKKLSQIMDVDLLAAQKQAVEHQLLPWAKNAIPHQQEAAHLIEEGVDLLDFAIVEFVKAKNNQPPPPLKEGFKLAQDPTEEVILRALRKNIAALENERAPKKAKMKLGIGVTQNLKIKDDWETASKEEKKNMEERRRQMQQAKKEQQQLAKKGQRNAAKTQQMASLNLKAISERLYKKVAVPWEHRNKKDFTGEDSWNKLSSDLRQSLNQDIDSDIPEEYREAIEQYFREIAGKDKTH